MDFAIFIIMDMKRMRMLKAYANNILNFMDFKMEDYMNQEFQPIMN